MEASSVKWHLDSEEKMQGSTICPGLLRMSVK